MIKLVGTSASFTKSSNFETTYHTPSSKTPSSSTSDGFVTEASFSTPIKTSLLPTSSTTDDPVTTLSYLSAGKTSSSPDTSGSEIMINYPTSRKMSSSHSTTYSTSSKTLPPDVSKTSDSTLTCKITFYSFFRYLFLRRVFCLLSVQWNSS